MIKSLKDVIGYHSIKIFYHAYFQSSLKQGSIFRLTNGSAKKFLCLKKKVNTFDFQD
jgi:hypothetical protein